MKSYTLGEASRRQFMSYFSSMGLSSSLLPGVLWTKVAQGQVSALTTSEIREAAAIAGLQFTDQELSVMAVGINQNLHRYQGLRRQ
jgi:hypothetical protein